jgi:hypothetical protein
MRTAGNRRSLKAEFQRLVESFFVECAHGARIFK